MTSRRLPPPDDPGATDTFEHPELPGPDRRKTKGAKPDVRREVTFDANGKSVLEVRVETPGRRKDDDTVDLLECLDADSLSIEEDAAPDPAPGAGRNPYDRNEKS